MGDRDRMKATHLMVAVCTGYISSRLRDGTMGQEEAEDRLITFCTALEILGVTENEIELALNQVQTLIEASLMMGSHE